MKEGWKKYLSYFVAVLVLGGLALFLIRLGYSFPETGFGDFTNPDGEFMRGKTLWDWMELLIIPAVLAGGAILLNRSERNAEREITNERQQDLALQTYFDRMSELLLKEKLRTTRKAEVRDVARTRTLSIMRVLDTKRNNLIVQFLREAKLITDKNSILVKADMNEMNLQRLSLNGANLQGAKFMYANLQGAYLMYANLQGANLHGVNLQDANLMFANLQDANLQDGNLRSALLTSVNLQDAILVNANLLGTNLWIAENATVEQLAKAKSLKGATMPDGTKHA